jgi:glycyl-tRNA synthetase
LAPTQIAILPLVKKDGLPGLARDLIADLKWDYSTDYDEKDAVGRRYRRQDALGTPYCVTVDHQTLKDQTVTLRERDSMEQIRIPTKELYQHLNSKLNMKYWLSEAE